MVEHKPGYILAITLTFVVFIITVVINYLNSSTFTDDVFPGLFKTTISDELYIEVTPASWTFLIWAAIYLYQLLWLIYGWSTVCRKSNDWQGYLYYKPAFMPISIYVIYLFNLIANVAWLFTYDRQILVAATPILFFISISLYICIAISYCALHREGPILLRIGHKKEIGLVRGFVHNGLAMYATWTSIASLLSFGQTLTYQVGIDQKDSSSIVLGILGFEIIGYFLLDNFLIDKFGRFTFTPYFVLVFALAGSIAENWVFGERNSTITAVLLGLAGFSLIFKIVMCVQRCRWEPEPILRDVKIK